MLLYLFTPPGKLDCLVTLRSPSRRSSAAVLWEGWPVQTPALGKMAVAAILRDALREDTAKDTDPLLLLLSVWSRIGID